MQKILVLFKTHLDMGYTDFAEEVLRCYREKYIPQAIRVGNELMERGVPEGFVWSIGSWLVEDYLNNSSEADCRAMEDAIRKGIIRWHALPCTLHSEAASAQLFAHGLEISRRLDERFGKKTTASKFTDVPGHTRGVVPLLVQAGVTLLHIGVNPASMPPEVPDLFRWQAPDGSCINVMYNKGYYGEFAQLPGTQTGVLFAHTNDNTGPQSVDEIIEVYEKLRAEYPEAEIRSVDLTTLADEVQKIQDTLPVVTQEIGDTWIHGVMSAPNKVRGYRALLRMAEKWSEEERKPLYDELLLIPEHTWGMCGQRYLGDHEHFARAEFEQMRDAPNYRKIEASWREQENYVVRAVERLSGERKKEAQDCLKVCAYAPCDMRGLKQTGLRHLTLGKWSFGIDSTGALTELCYDGRALCGEGAHIGRFLYEVFSAREVQGFRDRYDRIDVDWSREDFGKPGLEKLDLSYRRAASLLKNVYAGEDRAVIEMQTDEALCALYGCPPAVSLEVRAQDEALECTLRWENKPASRIPEGLWVSFFPSRAVQAIEKLGQWVDPKDVVSCGGRELHCVDKQVKFDGLTLEILDAPVISLDEPHLYSFYNRQPAADTGLWMNLFNNMWSTNFPMWNEGSQIYRWRILPD